MIKKALTWVITELLILKYRAREAWWPRERIAWQEFLRRRDALEEEEEIG